MRMKSYNKRVKSILLTVLACLLLLAAACGTKLSSLTDRDKDSSYNKTPGPSVEATHDKSNSSNGEHSAMDMIEEAIRKKLEEARSN